MSTEQTWETDCDSLDQSLYLAQQLGSKLKGGEIIELVSDLGGGKTTFVRGLVAGAGSTDRVSSPSFTLTNQYQSGELTIYHFDFYRLSEPGIMRDELAEVITDPKAVVIVEWANIVADVLPANSLTVHITNTGETSRHYRYEYAPAMAYLLEEPA